jgi:predicted helicase
MQTARHPRRGKFIQSGIFRGLNSFGDLESRITALPVEERGAAFEVFAEAYLATQTSCQAKAVWPGNTLPLDVAQKLCLPSKDMGVDGVFETLLGDWNAYQVKFRSGRSGLTWDELSTFMGLADRVSERVLLTNTDDLPDIINQRQNFFCIRGTDFDRLDEEGFAKIAASLEGSVSEQPKKRPEPYQIEALKQIIQGLQDNDRATAIMACGTGKTLVALWVAERMEHRRILVLLPSLALIRQTLHEWLKETSWPELAYLCVCSDASVDKQEDAVIVRQSDLDFPVTTDPEFVRKFMQADFSGVRVVFSTYQSAKALKDVGGFDLGIFDEAHKTAGREGRAFGFALKDENISIRKRLFLTATPRHYSVRSDSSETNDLVAFSMDDPTVYGRMVHTLTFAKAAREGIICNYKVLISVITSEMVNEEVLRRGEVTVGADAVRARQVANQLALRDALIKHNLSKAFTFHRTVASAKSFTCAGPEGIQTHLPNFCAYHVSGEMRTADRSKTLAAFRDAPRAIVSNARCLTEGVDVPAVDMVAFLSPRKSRVDIVQATGRAMRKDRNNPKKTTGYILLPLYVDQQAGESLEAAILRTDFAEVWDVLQSLQEQDEVLADIVRQLNEARGTQKGFDDAAFKERVEISGPVISLDSLRRSITTICIDHIGYSWDMWFGKLLKYKAVHGDCAVPTRYKEDPVFGRWIWTQRQERKQGKLSADRITRLAASSNICGVSGDGRVQQNTSQSTQPSGGSRKLPWLRLESLLVQSPREAKYI